MTGLVYSNFDRKIHIRGDLKDTGETLLSVVHQQGLPEVDPLPRGPDLPRGHDGA